MSDIIILTNLSNVPISIDDMGIYLEENEYLDLLDQFTDKEIINSSSLEIEYDNLSVKLNNEAITYDELIAYFSSLTEYKHENLDTLKHGLSEPAYFETTKNSQQKTYLITYYNNASKTLKIREEEIIRDVNGKTSQIISRQYDINGNVYKTETQQLNRSVQGTIASISVLTS